MSSWANCSDDRTEVILMKRYACILVCTFLLSVFSPIATAQDDVVELYTLTGKVFDSEGNPGAETSIKVDSMTSSWSEDGDYTFTDITPGEHTVRAYFMNDGHTVVYRKMFFASDMELDWTEGKNWVTTEMFDGQGQHVNNSNLSTISLVEANEVLSPNNGRAEFGIFDIGNYFTVIANYGEFDNSTQYVHFKLQTGSSSNPGANDFDLHYGMNSKYGFVKDKHGSPLSGVTVSNGSKSTITNSDGFYLIQNLEIGSNQTFTFMKEEIEILEPLSVNIEDGPSWLNVSSNIEVQLPGNSTFITQTQTIDLSPLEIEWQGGNHTDFVSLYAGDELYYRGTANKYLFSPEETGTYEFHLESENNNGTTVNPQTLLIIVIPDQSEEGLWSIGMSWNYSIVHTPEYYHNRTYTAIGSETITDAFGKERDTFLVRVSDDTYEEGEKAYRWVDANNLLNVKTYWVDAPSSSSYFQEGQLGWNFTNDGQDAELLSGEANTLHFNRTNIIGVPGHPNGYDDTQNVISVTNDVMVETPAGVFSTTYFNITDVNDGVMSWELWYNESVRNWVKIVDRLPGSHSDSVISVLTSFDVPMTPQFTTEEGNLSVSDYDVQWAPFQGAASYQLIENEIIIYEGNNKSFSIENQEDGVYTYQINAVMASGLVFEGDILELNLVYIVPPPVLTSNFEEIDQGEEITFSWSEEESAAWYSLIVQDAEGITTEYYNGTVNSISIEDLPVGQNRIRVQAGLSDGKVSEYSDSIFVTVEDKKDDDDSLPTISGIFTIFILIFSSLMLRRRQ